MKANFNEIPNNETIKALEDKNLFSAETTNEMIADCLGEPNWRNSYKITDNNSNREY